MQRHSGGFTLIELTLVIILMGFFLSLTMPRIRDTLLSDDFKSSSRKLLLTIISLRTQAISGHKDYELKFDLETNRYWSESRDMLELELAEAREQASVLPETVVIKAVLFKNKDRVTAGEVSIRFSKKGYIQPSIIHLEAEDGRKFSFELSPFLGKVTISEEYIEFADMEY